MKDKIIILTGPTGVGKTKLSLELAKKINGEIISCDAYQVYKLMDIGTDKLKPNDYNGVVHHNLDIIYPNDEFNAALFKETTENLISDISSRNKIPILVGGTGLYIHSLIYEMNFGEIEGKSEIRQKINETIEKNGLEYIYRILEEIDPNIGKHLDKNNTHRVIRAYEIYLITNNKPSLYLSKFRDKNKKYEFLYFVLTNERAILYENINNRVEQMRSKGLLNEIEILLGCGYSFDMKSFKAIGYKEFEPYFSGEVTLDEAFEKVKQNSRNFAKRQITWFKKEESAIWINKNEYENDEKVLERIIKYTEEFL